MSCPYKGDIAEDATITDWWNTNNAAGASITRAVDGTIKVRRDDGQDCTGGSVTDTEDTPDVGIHEVAIDTSDNANYAIGHDYVVWLDGATIDGETVNAALFSFSIENRTTLPKADAPTAIQAGAQAALVANNLDHVAKTATAGADMTAELVDNTILSRILANGDTSAFTPSTDGLQPIRDQGDAAWVTATGFATPTNITAGTIATLTNAPPDSTGVTEILTRLPDATAGQAGGLFIAGTNAATTITTALTANVIGNITGNLSGSVGSIGTDGIDAAALKTDAVAEIADGVWDEAQSGHTTAGTFGKYLDSQISLISLAGIANAIWDEPQSGHTAAGTFGYYLDVQVSGYTSLWGAGAITFTVTVQDGGASPIEGCDVWVTSDAGGSNVVAGKSTTDALGQIVFYLDAATYYLWKQVSGWNFTNPESITVS